MGGSVSPDYAKSEPFCCFSVFPTDRFLILKYKAGSPSVLPELVERYHKIFCEKAYWITKDRETAKDTTQESWIAIINSCTTLENLDRVKSWACRVVYTKAIDAVT